MAVTTHATGLLILGRGLSSERSNVFPAQRGKHDFPHRPCTNCTGSSRTYEDVTPVQRTAVSGLPAFPAALYDVPDRKFVQVQECGDPHAVYQLKIAARVAGAPRASSNTFLSFHFPGSGRRAIGDYYRTGQRSSAGILLPADSRGVEPLLLGSTR